MTTVMSLLHIHVDVYMQHAFLHSTSLSEHQPHTQFIAVFIASYFHNYYPLNIRYLLQQTASGNTLQCGHKHA